MACTRFGHGDVAERFCELGTADFVSTSTYSGVGTTESANTQLHEELDDQVRSSGLQPGPSEHTEHCSHSLIQYDLHYLSREFKLLQHGARPSHRDLNVATSVIRVFISIDCIRHDHSAEVVAFQASATCTQIRWPSKIARLSIRSQSCLCCDGDHGGCSTSFA